MTREEAIDIVKCLAWHTRPNEEDIESAIEALKQQPSEEEKVIRIKKGTLKARTGRYVIYDVEWLKTHFNTTEAKIYGQPKTGHWIEHKSNGMSYIECPKCSSWFLRIHLTRNSYCPNCGSYNGGDTNPQPSENLNVVLDELNRIGRNAFKDDTDYDNLFDFISNLPNVKPQPEKRTEERTETHACDCINRQAAIDALWKALHEYEDKTENQFSESKELDVADWFQHRIFVQNMSDIDRQTILNLPSVNPQPNEDCISRKAVLEGLASIAKAKAKSDTQKSLMGRVMFFTEHLPSVAPQPKTAHWEWTQYDSKPNFGNWHCSACRSIVVEHVPKTSVDGIPLYKYCPQCGAKMIDFRKVGKKD